ncbi:meiotically upregulated Mug123 [Schizosaccharomyces japonicus yFS275]|uniref:Meiotically upregulated Mug123 n=1 Tax=Schizosaccharomyces japonicus (strain yFS275 / FY16936) TaxID=402676 RepID=B6K6E3_SCHJY|nr:meiotically upregulated Mug123 [Schizosaccharomyces japonicus yFS275]EEB09097.1 meiotically upregulated Mug123 [Schizosaccharomyces japonicus yFS275]
MTDPRAGLPWLSKDGSESNPNDAPVAQAAASSTINPNAAPGRIPAPVEREERGSYVQNLRRAKATVWTDQGRLAPVNSLNSRKMSQHSKKGFSKSLGSMRSRVFSSQHHNVHHTRPASLHSKATAPQHTLLTPRLSATEGRDDDEEDFKIASASQSFTFTPFAGSSRASSMHSTDTPSLMGMSMQSATGTNSPHSEESASGSGSPTHELQSYLVTHRSDSFSSSDWEEPAEGAKRFVVTNATEEDELDSD